MAVVGYVYWSIRPELLRFGPLAVRWYGLFFALLFLLGYQIVRWQFRIEGKNEKDLDRLLAYVLIGTLAGARLGHCLLYDPAYYLTHPLEILAVWKGGLASHGGTVGIFIALCFYARRRPDQPYLWLLDRLVVPAALGGCLIRLGNLFNSEILGRPARVPWAFVFTRVDSVPRHPVQLYESAAYLLIFVLLLLLYNRLRSQTPRGLLLGLFLVSVFTFRFFIEFLKERQAAYGENLPLSVGQFLSLPLVVLGVVLLWRASKAGRTA